MAVLASTVWNYEEKKTTRAAAISQELIFLQTLERDKEREGRMQNAAEKEEKPERYRRGNCCMYTDGSGSMTERERERTLCMPREHNKRSGQISQGRAWPLPALKESSRLYSADDTFVVSSSGGGVRCIIYARGTQPFRTAFHCPKCPFVGK